MSTRHFIAFDLGAESGRAVLGTLDNGKLKLTEKHRFANPTGRMNGRLQWNLLGQWEELKTGLRKSAFDGSTQLEISGIGVDTWGVDFGLIDKNGDVLGNPIHYRDSRTDGVMERAFREAGKERIFDATGVQFMQFNTLFQLFAMREGAPASMDQAETLLFMPDLFHYLFTGIRKTEFSIASTSQMYDPREKKWATALLKQLDIPARLLADVVPSGTLLGNVKPEVADECGVANIPVITPASHDTASAVAAVPASGQDWCFISSGTWSLMGVELIEPIINDKCLKLSYTNEGGVGGTIRFLKNIAGLWLVQECRRQWSKEGHEHSYSELTQMAARSKGTGAVIDPASDAFLTPGDMPAKIARFCEQSGQITPTTRGDFVRCCLESLALTYRKTLQGLEEILDRKLTTLHIVGGGSQNETLNQFTADACGRTVVAGPVEATAIGNILVQAMAVGEIQNLKQAREIVAASFDVKRYDPKPSKAWDAAYERYLNVIETK